MGCAGDVNQRMTAVFIVEPQAFVNIVIRSFAVGCWKIQYGKAYLTAHSRIAHSFGNGLIKEIHIRKAGGAAGNHLSHSQPSAVANKLFADMARLRRPDMLFQPGPQGQVVGIAAQQAHGTVAMGIDQPGHQYMVVQGFSFDGFKALFGLGLGVDANNFFPIHSQ